VAKYKYSLKSFEYYLVVDDGSVDFTRKMVEEKEAESNITSLPAVLNLDKVSLSKFYGSR
jgi:glycosyltransferase involved in cell wall biosynthesis